MGLSPGMRLGQYEIVAAIGAGGMGEVYRARDTRLQRPAAIKVILAADDDTDRVRRLEKEALAASALNHPNILTVYEFGVHEGLQYIATELVEGETLRDRIRAGPIAAPAALDIAIQIAAALEAAHAAGIVHRDIKPENVMIRPDGYVKVLDFGIAKLIPTSDAAAESNTLTVNTVPGMLVGTVGYMAPEQIRGLPVDHRADIWSFAVVLHEMLTGRSPFAGPTSSDVIAAVLERNPPSLASAGVATHPQLERIIGKALAKDREERYQSMKEVGVDLRRKETQIDEFRATTGKTEGRRPLMLAAVGLLLAGLVGWIGWSWMQPPSPRDLSVPPGESTTATAPTRTFSYWLTVETPRAGRPAQSTDSPGNQVYSRGAKFLFNFSNPEPGHVYVLNEAPGASGGSVLTMLYPTPSVRAGSARVNAGEVAQTGFYLFDPKADVERVWIAWSREPQVDLERAKRYVTETDFGQVKDPEEAAALQRLLESAAKRGTTALVDDGSRQTVVSGRGDLLVHKAELRTR